MKARKHTLLLVGHFSEYIGYLDLSRDEALRRYAEHGICEDPEVEVIEFDDCFSVYSAEECEE